MTSWRSKGRLKDEAGSVLVEFALVSLALIMIMAATVDFGRMFLLANVVQSTARNAAVALSLAPAAKSAGTLDALLTDAFVKCTIYNPGLLVIDPTDPEHNDPSCLPTYPDTLPQINEMLFRTAMISDVIGGRNLYHYPGAIFSDATATSGYSISIPQVTGRDGTGVEGIVWVPALKECPEGALAGGQVSVCVNYPFQAAMLSGFRPSVDGPFEPNIVDKSGNWGVNDADDASVSAPSTPDTESDSPYGAYAGPYGLGKQLAFAGKTVRPYRWLITQWAAEGVR